MKRPNFLLRIATLVVGTFVLTSAGFTSPGLSRAETISISPPEFQLFGNPGDVLNETVKVNNNSQNAVTYTTSVEDFSASGDTGGISISDDPNAPTTNFSLKKWIVLEPSQFSVAANAQKLVNMQIIIPKNAEPGGHYATVRVNAGGGNVSGGGASVQSQLNSLVLLRVSGNVTEKLSLQAFNTSQYYYQYGPVSFNLKTKNTGNVHVAPNGTIVITDMFNHKVAEIPLRLANVLPDSSRAITTSWTEKSMVGKFTATLVANYGDGTNIQPLTASTTFIVFPLIYVWIALVIIIIIILLITKRRSFRKILHRLTSD
jgi:hypothetical protein